MKDEIIDLLQCKDKEKNNILFKKAAKIKLENVGNKVYLRGLIEYSNVCQKNCLYCGLRNENNIKRYSLTEEEVVNAVIFAHKNNFASIVIQSGEVKSNSYTKKITRLLNKINEHTNGELGITLSLGEQTKNTLKEWKDIGQASRYLLRIETSNQNLYNKIHPNDKFHSFNKRLKTLNILKDLDYQVGTGVMIGLPFQTIQDLALDIFFLKENDIDMIGMGPYIEHAQTPLYSKYKNILLPLQDRFELTLKMIAIIRIMMPTINIAATTALQVIDTQGREKAILAGANIIMPNISPVKYRKNYLLYENKICIEDTADKCMNCISNRIRSVGAEIGFGEQGNSLHFIKKKQNNFI
jgi:biotin synthase